MKRTLITKKFQKMTAFLRANLIIIQKDISYLKQSWNANWIKRECLGPRWLNLFRLFFKSFWYFAQTDSGPASGFMVLWKVS